MNRKRNGLPYLYLNRCSDIRVITFSFVVVSVAVYLSMLLKIRLSIIFEELMSRYLWHMLKMQRTYRASEY